MCFRKIFVAASFIACWLPSNSQVFTEADSLKRVLKTLTADTSRVQVLRRLCIALEYTYPDSALKYAEQGLQLAQRIHYKRGEAGCLNEIGAVAYQFGNYPEALSYFFKSLEIRQSLDDQQGMAICYDNIGLVYFDQGDGEQALENFSKALRIDELNKSDDGIMIDHLNIGGAYQKLDKPDSALHHTLVAYDIAKSINDEGYIGIILQQLGDIYAQLGNDFLAMENYLKSIPCATAISDFQNLSGTYLGMARMWKDSIQIDSAIHYAKTALRFAREAYVPLVPDAANLLASMYKKKGTSDSAVKYLEMVMAFKDSLFNQEKMKQVQSLTFNEKVRQQELAEAKKREAREHRNTLQLTGIAIFIIVFAITIILLSKRKVRPRLIETLGWVGTLLFFQFILLLLTPFVERFGKETPVWLLLIWSVVAATLIPLDRWLDHMLKDVLMRRRKQIE